MLLWHSPTFPLSTETSTSHTTGLASTVLLSVCVQESCCPSVASTVSHTVTSVRWSAGTWTYLCGQSSKAVVFSMGSHLELVHSKKTTNQPPPHPTTKVYIVKHTYSAASMILTLLKKIQKYWALFFLYFLLGGRGLLVANYVHCNAILCLLCFLSGCEFIYKRHARM